MAEEIQVSIIIVTYNNETVIEACLQALTAATDLTLAEVLVVDNASQDATRDLVCRYSGVRLLESADNLGFAGGNRVGLEAAQGEWLVLLNPDTEVQPGWLEALLAAAAGDPETGIVAAKLLNHGTGCIDSAGDGCLVTGRGYKRGDGCPGTAYSRREYVFGACGGAMLLRRQMLQHIGFLDEDFFLIYEDTDLCFRAKLAGWKCLYEPQAVVLHKVRSTIGEMSDTAVYYSIRNARLVWLKNMPTRLVWKYLPQQMLQELAVFFFFCLKHGKWRPYARAARDCLKGWPQLMAKRRRVQALRVLPDRELESWLTPLFSKDVVREKWKKVWNNK